MSLWAPEISTTSALTVINPSNSSAGPSTSTVSGLTKRSTTSNPGAGSPSNCTMTATRLPRAVISTVAETGEGLTVKSATGCPSAVTGTGVNELAKSVVRLAMSTGRSTRATVARSDAGPETVTSDVEVAISPTSWLEPRLPEMVG